MIEVTALIDGPGSSPQRASHWRRASAIGSNGRSGMFAGESVTRGGPTRRTGWMRTDAELLADDFGAFYERHLDTVTAYIDRRNPPPEQTLYLVAETFARALQHRGRFDVTRGPVIAWLLGIARNLLLDAARRVLRDEEYESIAEDVGCSESVIRQRMSRGLAALGRAL